MDAPAEFEPDRLLTVQQVTDCLSISRQTLYALVNAGDFPPPLRIGPRAVRWRLSAINRYLDRKEKDATLRLVE